MEAGRDSPLFLLRTLEELDGGPDAASCQELCRSLCARLDPHLPAALFRDGTQGAAADHQAQKVSVAADIVAMFNLLQMSGGPPRERPAGRPRAPTQEPACPACQPAGSHHEAPGCGLDEPPFSPGYPGRPAACARDCPQFVPASQPSFLLGAGREPKDRAASLDQLQALAPYGAASPQPCEMQRTCFPARLESQPPVPEPLPCGQKRGVCREAVPSPTPVSPGGTGPAGRAGARGGPRRRRDPHGAPFFAHSFEMPARSPPPHPAKGRPAKHESLGDLQASTYFGPGPRAPAARHCAGWPGWQAPWPAKSWSLSAERAPGLERSFFGRSPSEGTPRCPSPGGQAPRFPATDRHPAYLGPEPLPPGLPSGYSAAASGPSRGQPPAGLQVLAPARSPGARGAGGPPSLDTSSVGTQTEGQGPGRPSQPRPPDEGSEAGSEDISGIFRFLDDVSEGGSTGPPPSSCCGSGSPPEHSPACATGRRAAQGGQPAEELRASVCRLALRLGALERKLDSLSGVRAELSQVLGQLSSLDRRLRRPEQAGPQMDLHSLTSEAPSDRSGSPRTPGPMPQDSGDWCCPGAGRSLPAAAPTWGRPGPRPPARDSSSDPARGRHSEGRLSRQGWGGEAQDSAPGEGKDWLRKSEEVT
ncbi:Major intrinsically disordered Notch2-binding receptor 1 [Galemys pyrenaicus]|uniref:Major intrinsically disordered Notch2-binding receptor 1 n=1 Tax=Galemys pyrenaicus TaxID=202257 RepID=A0A8J6A9C7_GALPY|nr:Major intrinsically disordered Notch2-binding receptor 1 [Galemys pyrenaicus]